MLEYDNISFSYPQADGLALEGVSLSLAPGESVALLGRNGSGKSTLARLGNATYLPDSGTVRADGLATDERANLRAVRTTVGVVAQDPETQIVQTTVEDEVAFGPENLGLPRAEIATRVSEAIAEVGLAGKEKREPHTLSGGEKQRLVIAGILAMHPTYIIFDEPTSMLDARGRAEVMRVIRRLHEQGVGILLITHDPMEACRSDRVAVLDHGRITYTGAPRDLFLGMQREASFDAASGESPLMQDDFASAPLLELAARLAAAGVELPQDITGPAALASAVVTHAKAAR